MMIINPRISRNTASTKIISIIFSLGFIRISKLHPSLPFSFYVKSTNSMLLGIIGVHLFIALVPFVGTLTVKDSIKLLLLPIPI